MTSGVLSELLQCQEGGGTNAWVASAMLQSMHRCRCPMPPSLKAGRYGARETPGVLCTAGASTRTGEQTCTGVCT
eukprot:1477392-Alexandrium_andersonii.AAC.1